MTKCVHVCLLCYGPSVPTAIFISLSISLCLFMSLSLSLSFSLSLCLLFCISFSLFLSVCLENETVLCSYTVENFSCIACVSPSLFSVFSARLGFGYESSKKENLCIAYVGNMPDVCGSTSGSTRRLRLSFCYAVCS